MRHATRSALTVAILLGSITGTATPAGGDVESFPDDWFFSGGEQHEVLRSLEGKEAAEISIAEWRGDEVTLADQRGKVIVLDFWATWCGPCLAAIPKNVALVDKYKSDGLVFIGMHDSNAGWDRVDDIIRERSINYAVALDDSSASAEAYEISFLPTYVLIDRSGIVRAAGLVPAHLEEATKILLDEPYEGAPPATAAKASGFPDAWYYGGELRPRALVAAEGEPMKPLLVAEWRGEPVTPAAWERRVLVLQFVRPEVEISLQHLQAIEPLAERYAAQGVVFAAVCDARGDWERMQTEAEARAFSIPIARDAPLEEGVAGGGATGASIGVRYAPVLAVVDRSGTVRAVGLQQTHLEEVLNRLLAERLPAPPVPPTPAAEPAEPPTEKS